MSCNQNRKMRFRLCTLEELPDPGSRGFEVEVSTGSFAVFVVRRADQVFGYINNCPHTGVELNWVPHQFLDIDDHYIQCATHGALFTLDKGKCVRGPCAGENLTSINLELHNDTVFWVTG